MFMQEFYGWNYTCERLHIDAALATVTPQLLREEHLGCLVLRWVWWTVSRWQRSILTEVKGTTAPDFKACRAKQNTFDGLDVIACTESRACLFKAVSSTAQHWGPGEMRVKLGPRVPVLLSAVTKRMLWLKQDSWPGDNGHPGDIFGELRSADKTLFCTHLTNV